MAVKNPISKAATSASLLASKRFLKEACTMPCVTVVVAKKDTCKSGVVKVLLKIAVVAIHITCSGNDQCIAKRVEAESVTTFKVDYPVLQDLF